MVRKKRNSKLKKLRYFFLNDKVHKVLRSSRSKDEIVAWCYPDHKRVMYSYSQVEKHMEHAYSMKDVLQVHEFILDSGHSKNVPSRAELLGLFKHNIILYTKTDSGFVPVWKAE